MMARATDTVYELSLNPGDVDEWCEVARTLHNGGMQRGDAQFDAVMSVVRHYRPHFARTLDPEPSSERLSREEIVRAQVVGFRALSRNMTLPSEASAVVSKAASLGKTKFNLRTRVRRAPENSALELNNRVRQRLLQLLSLPPDLPPEQKLRAEIEYMQLTMMHRQQLLRESVSEDLYRSCAMEASLVRGAYLRERRAPEGNEDDTYSLLPEGAAPSGQKQPSSRLRKKYRGVIHAAAAHAGTFKAFHVSIAQRNRRASSGVLKFHVYKARREQMQKEREEKERLRALRNNDEEAYLKLLETTKNDRLHQLLHQTDDYLDKIGALVEQQKSIAERAGVKLDDDGNEKDAEDGSSGDGAANGDKDGDAENASTSEDGADKQIKKKTYYTQAHTIEEEITQQPDMLVGGTLKHYQVLGLQWLVSLYNNGLNGILADEMGLGKTIQTIALVCYLMEQKRNMGPYLIIVPLSTLQNWVNEFEKWAPSVICVKYAGGKPLRKALAQKYLSDHTVFNVLIVQYEFVLSDKYYLCKVPWEYVVVDEGHRMKNRECRLTQTLRKDYRSKHRVLLTGTPLQNSLTELWSLLNFLLPSIFNSADNFEQWFSAPFAAAGEQLEMTEEEQLLIINRLHKVLRPFLLRRLKTEVELELPDKEEEVLRCETSALQRRMYRSIQQNGCVGVVGANKQRRAVSLNNAVMQLRKVCNHPFLFYEEYYLNDNLIRASAKFNVLDRILPKFKATGHKVLIFCQMRQLMDILADFFELRGITYLRLDGCTNASTRGDLLHTFNEDGGYDVFMLSTRAGGLGLNLQTADTVIIFDSDWNPQMDLQAQDRAHRIGQKNVVRIYRLICVNTIEEYILDTAHHKLNLDAKIIQAGMYDLQSSAEDRKEYLATLLKEDTTGLKGTCNTSSDARLNRIIARNDEEYAIFQRMDRELRDKRAREWKAAGNSGKPPPRLMTEEELLPEMEVVSKEKKEKELAENYGRGRRSRPEVVYDDGLSESQFTRMIEKQEREKERQRAAKQKQKRRPGRPRKERPPSPGGGSDTEEEDDEEAVYLSEEEDGQESTEHAAKRRRTSMSSERTRVISNGEMNGDATESEDEEDVEDLFIDPSLVSESGEAAESRALEPGGADSDGNDEHQGAVTRVRLGKRRRR